MRSECGKTICARRCRSAPTPSSMTGQSAPSPTRVRRHAGVTHGTFHTRASLAQTTARCVVLSSSCLAALGYWVYYLHEGAVCRKIHPTHAPGRLLRLVHIKLLFDLCTGPWTSGHPSPAPVCPCLPPAGHLQARPGLPLRPRRVRGVAAPCALPHAALPRRARLHPPHLLLRAQR